MLDSLFFVCYSGAGMSEKVEEISLLYDFYGKLLPEKQRELIELYNEDDMSLAEIAAEKGVSRQAVHEAVKKAEKALNDYESKLGLVAEWKRSHGI